MNPRFRFNLTTAGLTGLFAVALPFSLSAAPTAGGSGSSAPTSSAYTNQPTPSIDNSFYNYGTTFNTGSSFGDPFYGRSTYYYVAANYFYFPPVPPALGQTVIRRGPPFFGIAAYRGRPESAHAVPITAQLSAYVGESFYPPLATHLHNEDLTKKQFLRLSAYRDTRAELLSALHAKLDALKDADAATRQRELSAFAQEQAPKVDAFEQEAEGIRDDLVRGGFFRSGVEWSDWDANRSWRLGDDLRYESRIDEFKVIRAAAYFYPNLIPAQRRLLQELAMELNEPLTDSSAVTALDAPDSYFYLSPETARVHLPPNLPDDLAAKIVAYQKEKAALKEEIRAAIYKLDRSWFNFTRKATLNPLAEQQAPRIAALENMAEEIRRGLAPLPNPNRVSRTTPSNDMAVRVGAYTRERQQIIRNIDDKKNDALKTFPTARIESNVSNTMVRITLIPNRRQSKAEAEALPAFQQGLARFNDEQSQKLAALDRSKAALRAEVLKSVSTPGTTSTSMDAAVKTFAAEYRRYQILELFGDYDYAVFEPGLSPGQRRLLYNSAIQKLDLPIPSGSPQP